MTNRLTLPAFAVSSSTSLFGNAAIGIVLPWLVLERTGDPTAAGLVAAVSAVPGAVASFTGGWLIDRLGRRRMAVLSDVGSALSVAGLAIVDRLIGLDISWFIALGVLGALFDGPGMTARQTLVQDVADASGVSLERISGLQGAIFGLSFLAGPAAAGALLTVLPTIDVVWLTAACSALAALCVGIMPLVVHPSGADTDRSLLAGLSFVRRCRPLMVLLVLQLGSAALTAPLLSIVLPAHFTRMGAPGLLGVSLSAYALGTVVGSVLFGWGFAGRQWAAWVLCQICLVGFALLIAPLTGFWLVAASMCVCGIGCGLLQPIAQVMVTTGAPDVLRGRVFAVYSALSLVSAPVGLGVMTAVVAGAGLGTSTWVMAAGWALLTAWSLVAPGMKDYLDESSTSGERQAVREEAGC